MKTLTAILNFFGFRTAKQKASHHRRSVGAKAGWAKRKAKHPQDDVQ